MFTRLIERENNLLKTIMEPIISERTLADPGHVPGNGFAGYPAVVSAG